MVMKSIYIALAILVASTSAFATPVTIILTRHGEKKTEKDPDLTSEGKKRAETLTKLKNVFNITHIYSSDTKRTVATVKPLANDLDLKVDTTFDPKNYAGMVADMTSKYAGQTVVVSGHSNTIPGFVNYLMGDTKQSDIGEKDFTNLFIIQYDGPGKSQVLRFNQEAKGDKLSLAPRAL